MEVGHWVDRAGRSVDVIAANENEVKSHSLDQILDWTLTAARAAHGDDYHSEASDVMSVLIRDENNGVRAAFVHPGMWEVMVTALNIVMTSSRNDPAYREMIKLFPELTS